MHMKRHYRCNADENLQLIMQVYGTTSLNLIMLWLSRWTRLLKNIYLSRRRLFAFVSGAIVTYAVCLLLYVHNEHAKYVMKTPTVDTNEKGTVPCDIECQRFRRLMAQWPPTKPKAAIVYLAYRLRYLVPSITSVADFFCRKFDYPVVIFHEADMLNTHAGRDAVLKAAAWNSTLVFFQKVEFKTPTFLTEPVPLNISCHSTIGYRHMCRFQAKGKSRKRLI